VADTVNPETRTVTVRSRVDNAGRQLKPAMLATMLIQAAAVERIVVPAEAVVREATPTTSSSRPRRAATA
jgi:cobalt-zinc-cadmium efflux system membrane fusion protein